MSSKTISKYLSAHAEPELPRELDPILFFPKPHHRYRHVVVIPLYGEGELWLKAGFPSLLEAAREMPDPTLLILVVNRHERSPDWVGHHNQQILDFFSSYPSHAIAGFPFLTLYGINPSLDLLLMNHNEAPYLVSSQEGVGKARKLGCDLALRLSTSPILECKYLHTTDGDAVVEKDYFTIEHSSQAGVLLHPYLHIGNYSQMEALHIYERSLRYYVAGLRYARSPYAHESLGSTIAISPQCYAAVRGFPKRNAAEDFYLLNKAVKVDTLEQASAGLVKLIGRESDRVPFGTGVGTQKIWHQLSQQQTVTFYHPRCFEILKNLNAYVDSWSRSNDLCPVPETILSALIQNTGITDWDPLRDLLENLGFFEILATAKRQRDSAKAILKHCHESWDGFKTLKFIHGVRDRYFGEIPFDQVPDLALLGQ